MLGFYGGDFMEETLQGYEPVNQLYTAKTRSDGAASKWQVDTGLIRQFLDEKLKGFVRKEIEYVEYEIIDKSNKMAVSRFVAKNNTEARSKLALLCEVKDVDIRTYGLQPTGETEYREIVVREKVALLPDEVVDAILVSVETTFSQVGYLTKYSENDIRDEVYRNISAIRLCLANKCLNRTDIDQENLEIVINLVKNTIYQVLKASQDGWTGNRMSDITSEKITTVVPPKKILSLGG